MDEATVWLKSVLFQFLLVATKSACIQLMPMPQASRLMCPCTSIASPRQSTATCV
ncbi:hypothetical protein HanPSC8_Chr12g0513241 [Helianthus annuus]|nr:hypothetical protein HanPSC8_Chr12g0513241 [Helianthus annuus]